MGVTQDWATHMIGHELTALHGLTHGATLAIVINGTLRVLRGQKRGKLLQYGERIWGIAGGSEEERIDRTIAANEAFFRSLGLSTRLSEEGIGEETIAEIERRFTAAGDRFGEAQNVDAPSRHSASPPIPDGRPGAGSRSCPLPDLPSPAPVPCRSRKPR